MGDRLATIGLLDTWQGLLDWTRVQMNALGYILTLHLSVELRAATSASSQLSPILWRSFLMTPLQFVIGRPGQLLNPGTSQYSVCCGIRWWTIRIRCPSQRSLISLIMFSMLCCPVLALTSSLWPPYGIRQAIIFLPCGFYLSSSFSLWPPYVIGGHNIFVLWFLPSIIFLFSSPNLSRCRLDVYHTCTHGVALVRI